MTKSLLKNDLNYLVDSLTIQESQFELCYFGRPDFAERALLKILDIFFASWTGTNHGRTSTQGSTERIFVSPGPVKELKITD